MSNPEKKKTIKTSIGGQAVIEGVMMRRSKGNRSFGTHA